MSRTVYDLIGLAAGIAFILALKGLSHPKTARRGNLIGAFGAGLATLVVFFLLQRGIITSIEQPWLDSWRYRSWFDYWRTCSSQGSDDSDATTCCTI